MLEQPVEIAGVVVADATQPGCPLTYVSPGFEQLTGYAAEDVLGSGCSRLQGPETDPRSIEVLRQAIREGREAYVTLLNYRADGSTFWNEVALAPQHDADGRVVQYLGVQKDVTSRLQANARIHELANRDSLTGLLNRGAFQRELHDALGRCAEHEQQLALLFVDIDDFKRVNDTYGHLTGDALLVAVAQRLRSILRPGDVLARPGGDEFQLLVQGVTDVSDISIQVASRVVSALQQPFEIDGITLGVRGSVGVSAYPRDAAAADELLRHSDAAMYVAKGAGKNGFQVYRARATPAGHEPGADFDAEAHAAELDRIISEQAITTVFQPIVDIASEQAVGYEALARGPEGSPLCRPDLLFAAAVAADRVVELDWLCRATAVRTALDAGLHRHKTLFLNCEPSAFGSECPPAHAEVWEQAMRELDLVLEITERAVTDRPAELSLEVKKHRSAGHGIALDDVGADVRSLALLPLVEPDVIKLDLRLVQDRPSTDQAAIVSAVAVEHERTGAAILAEGIETEAHLAIARTLGATLGQGWLWGRQGPLPRPNGPSWTGRRVRSRALVGRTPFEVVAAQRETKIATKRLLLPMSHHLENRALQIGEGAVLLAAFQHARHFTAVTRRRYETLVRGASLCAALGVGLTEEPVPGVRGAHLEPDDALAGEWSVVVIGPHFAGALVAQDLGDTSSELDRRFEFTVVYDRDLVVAAAQTLLRRIAPIHTRAAATV